jgi:hypothetical protein
LVYSWGRFVKPEVEEALGERFDEVFAMEEHEFSLKAARGYGENFKEEI